MNIRRAILAIAILLTIHTSVLAVPFLLHVSETGNDLSGDGSESNPFRTLGHAIFVADTLNITNGCGISVGPGTWTAGTGGTETMPIAFRDSIRIYGSGIGQTIINAGGNSSAVVIDANFCGMEDVTITGGIAPSGAGIIIGSGADDIYLASVEIQGNAATVTAPKTDPVGATGIGGGILISGATNVLLNHVIVRDNISANEGGGIYIQDSEVSLVHLTVAENSSIGTPNSSAIYVGGSSSTNLTASIVWRNGNSDGLSTSIGGTIVVDNSLVENIGGSVFAGENNAWGDPLFVEEDASDVHLLEGSPAIDLCTYGPNLEPAPNGDAANAGMYGATNEATTSGANFTLDKGRLYFVGVPVEPPVTSPTSVFQDDFGVSPSDSTWDLYKHDLSSSFGGPTAPDFTIEPGKGYFIRQKLAPKFTVNAEGHALTQQSDFLRALPDISDGSGPYDWSWVANPYPYPIHLSNTMYGVVSAGNIPFADAAASELGSRYAYVLGGEHRLIPTTGVLDPWEGAILLTRNIDEWQVAPNRDVNVYTDPTEDLDWMLRLNVRAIDAEGTVYAEDNGHQWGFGPTSSDSLDDGDALSIALTDNAFRIESLAPTATGDEIALFHDFRSSIRDSVAIWKYQVTGPDSLPANLQIEFTGIDTTIGAQFPDSTLGLWIVYSWGDQDLPTLVDNLRWVQDVELGFDSDGQGNRQATFWLMVDSTGWKRFSSVEEPGAGALPEKFEIASLYPNPFNPTTTLTVTMPERGELKVQVFDILGREVATLASGVKPEGLHRLVFDGQGLASGVYFVRAVSGSSVDVKKMVMLR